MAPAELIAKLNAKVDAGQLKNRVGKSLTGAIESGLIRERIRVALEQTWDEVG